MHLLSSMVSQVVALDQKTGKSHMVPGEVSNTAQTELAFPLSL